MLPWYQELSMFAYLLLFELQHFENVGKYAKQRQLIEEIYPVFSEGVYSS